MDDGVKGVCEVKEDEDGEVSKVCGEALLAELFQRCALNKTRFKGFQQLIGGEVGSEL